MNTEKFQAGFGKIGSRISNSMKPLKIGISARGLNSFASGPNEYITGLIGELSRQAAGRHDLFIYYNTSRLLGRFPGAHEHVIPGNHAFLWDHLLLPLRLLHDHLDLVIYPKGTIPFLSPAAKVSIMLDLGYFYPALKAYKPADTLYMRLAMRYAAMNSKHIFAISEHTRQDVIRLLKVDPGRVHNIYGAASEQYRRVTGSSLLEGIRRKYDLYEPFIFYPTNFSPRKNFSRLLDAFERIQGDIPHHLYFTGQVLWGSQDLAVQLKRLAARVHRLGLVPIEDMPGIYSLAQFAIYPSLFEGLGLPILEGFQCGTPMMVSDQSSIPEVAGDAALMVDAYDIEAIAEGLIKMAADADLRQRLIRAGFEQARLFTWEKSVKALLDVLESDQ